MADAQLEKTDDGTTITTPKPDVTIRVSMSSFSSKKRLVQKSLFSIPIPCDGLFLFSFITVEAKCDSLAEARAQNHRNAAVMLRNLQVFSAGSQVFDGESSCFYYVL